jgi:regulator of replication initiation timing
VKTRLYAALCLSLLCALGLSSAAVAQDDLESRFAQFQQQFDKLSQRVDRLEQENVTLRAENERLKASADAVASTAVESKKPAAAAPATADWPSRIALKGDLRYRHQQTDDERNEAQRDEHLLRVRTSIEAKVTDTITAGVGFSTGDGGNPRGANTRMDGVFARKSLFLDLGYVDWTVAQGAHAIGGKMKTPFFRPGQSLYWDNDINPEGIAFTYTRGTLFGSAYGYWIDENVQVSATPSTTADTTDTKLFGGQIGNRFKFADSSLVIGASYYDLAAGVNRRPFYNGSSNGNSLNPAGGLAYDFRVLELMTEYNTRLIDRPLQLWVDVAKNQDAELDTAITAGALFGKAADRGTWEVGLAYEVLEKDALFAQLIDSDFAGGVSDSSGWILRGAYAPQKNWVLNLTYFDTIANMDVGDEYSFDRLMLDFNVKF